jgi:hypothetical protein
VVSWFSLCGVDLHREVTVAWRGLAIAGGGGPTERRLSYETVILSFFFLVAGDWNV